MLLKMVMMQLFMVLLGMALLPEAPDRRCHNALNIPFFAVFALDHSVLVTRVRNLPTPER